MADDEHSYVHISVRRLASLVVGAFALGASTVGSVQAYINSITSVEVAVQNGEAIQALRAALNGLSKDVVVVQLELDEYKQDRRQQERTDETQDRRIEAVEMVIDRR